MTNSLDGRFCDACPAHQSTLLFDRADLIAVRLLPAQFSRIVGVSKQSVSKWVRSGKVTLGPDGRLDPVTAIQEVLRKTAPTRLRARIFRQAMQGAEALSVEGRALQRKCVELEREIADARVSHDAFAQAAKLAAADVADRTRAAADDARTAFRRAVFMRFEQLEAARLRGWDALRWELDQIESQLATVSPNPSQ